MSSYQDKKIARIIENYEELDEEAKKRVLDEIKYQGALAAMKDLEKTTTVNFGDMLPELHKRRHTFNKFDGIACGLAYFDDATMGFRPGEVTIIAGPSNFGKTMVALNVVVSAAVKELKKVLIISLEMDKYQIGDRIYQMTDEHEKISRNVLIQTELTVNLRHIYLMIKKHKPDLVMVDHLQFLANQQPSVKEYERIVQAMAGIKRTSIDLHVPIIAISHVAKTRSGSKGEATASDLYGSARIEQDCDVGIMLNRRADDFKNQIELCLFKHRNKSPAIFHKKCIITLDGVKVANNGAYKMETEEENEEIKRSVNTLWST